MGYPLGKAPLADGTGTTPTDMQRIIGAQYMNSGLLPNGGLEVTGTSSMSYAVTAGAVFMWTSFASKLGMLVPVEATTVQTNPAPSTGSRTDTIYVDGDGAVRVAIGSSNIPSGVAIARFTVPAGITATKSATQSIDRNFAIPAGASLGRLAQWRDPGGGVVGSAETTRFTGRFHLPSDRVIRADMTTTIKSSGSTSGTAQFSLSFVGPGGAGSTRRMLAAHTPNWNTNAATWSFVATEGDYTVTVKTKNYSGGSFIFGNSSELLTEMNLWDAGVRK